MKTVVVGLLLAFLLFTPQGRLVAEIALLRAVQATPHTSSAASRAY
jgi:hypothetical protein